MQGRGNRQDGQNRHFQPRSAMSGSRIPPISGSKERLLRFSLHDRWMLVWLTFSLVAIVLVDIPPAAISRNCPAMICVARLDWALLPR
jgi:hypothetical protein